MSRIKNIEQLEDMLKSADGEYKPDKRTAGGVEGRLTNIEKMMNRLTNVVAEQRKEQEQGGEQCVASSIAGEMKVDPAAYNR